jgi:hypothetical protein
VFVEGEFGRKRHDSLDLDQGHEKSTKMKGGNRNLKDGRQPQEPESDEDERDADYEDKQDGAVQIALARFDRALHGAILRVVHGFGLHVRPLG